MTAVLIVGNYFLSYRKIFAVYLRTKLDFSLLIAIHKIPLRVQICKLALEKQEVSPTCLNGLMTLYFSAKEPHDPQRGVVGFLSKFVDKICHYNYNIGS